MDTGVGLILIDAMYPDSYQIIERGVQTIGLNIQELKYLIVGHGHADNTEAHGTSNIRKE